MMAFKILSNTRKIHRLIANDFLGCRLVRHINKQKQLTIKKHRDKCVNRYQQVN